MLQIVCHIPQLCVQLIAEKMQLCFYKEFLKEGRWQDVIKIQTSGILKESERQLNTESDAKHKNSV